ncbi:NAD-dependent epimerase/dehydratase family protein [Tenacibaculum geojense]|uniref:NAD-dependent epimerase/dehydratase family protein n=1 Tax=Tenacibaculum geojense TaxID=915352 RepID=A0ABW3JPQ3_9FLAO
MKNILITGGFGKIAQHFIKNNHQKYQITAADISTQNNFYDENVIVKNADLNNYNSCLELCKNIDTIIHLAGIVDPISESEDVLYTNIKTTQNIFKAAVATNCKKIIFASSAQTIESYATDLQIRNNMMVKPKNIYGVSKCFGEALAAYHAYNNGITAICLRIGAYEFPEDFTEMNARDLSAYLHPDDCNQLLNKCINTDGLQYEIFNAISNNLYKRLDLSETISKLGYNPKADAFTLFKLLKE